MFVVHMLNSAGEWEVSIKRFKYRHTALAWVAKNKINTIYNAFDIVDIS